MVNGIDRRKLIVALPALQPSVGLASIAGKRGFEYRNGSDAPIAIIRYRFAGLGLYRFT